MWPETKLTRFKKRLFDAAKEEGVKTNFRRMCYGNILTGREGVWVFAVKQDPQYVAAGLFRNPGSGNLRIEVYNSSISAQIANAAAGHANVSRPPSHYFDKPRVEKILYGYSPLKSKR